MYPKELYRNNHYRVVHSGEEERIFVGKGWKEEMDRLREDYVAHHSGVPEDEAEAPAKAPKAPKAPKQPTE